MTNKRWGLMAAIFLLIAAGTAVVAMAGSVINFSGWTPVNGSVVGTDRPAIGVRVSATEGAVGAGDVRMTLDGTPVTPYFTAGNTAGTYNISFTPAAGLSDGNHTVQVDVYDNALGRDINTSWTFAVDLTPKISSLAPAAGSVTETANPIISAYIRDSFDYLNAGSASLLIDGVRVTPAFNFRSRVEYDACTGEPYTIIESYQEGTLSYQATGLSDGLHTAELSIADVKGNVLTRQWSFRVGAKPVMSGITPAKGTLINTAGETLVSVRATDNTAINPDSIIMEINNNRVAYIFDPATGVISYRNNFGDGIYNVRASVADMAGNMSTANWSFTVSSDAAPRITTLAPADGVIVDSGIPKITAGIRDTYDNLNANTALLKINGAVVPARFAFKITSTTYDYCTGEAFHTYDYKEGTIEYQAANLQDGPHTAELSIADIKGNVLTKKWTFTVAAKPSFTGFTPAKGSANMTVSGISVKVTDNSAVNPGSIILKVNGNLVAHAYDAVTGTVVYSGSFNYGSNTVAVSAADMAGNAGTAGWSFILDNRPPEVKADPVYVWNGYYSQPNPFGSVTITDGKLKFRAELNDLIDIKGAGTVPDISLKLNGQALPADVSYQMHYDSYTGELLGVKSRKTAYVSYEGVIVDGTHTLTLISSDIFGNTGTETWTINVDTKPVITQWKPVAYISEFKPVISANIKDGNDTIAQSSIIMTLNGRQVAPVYDPVTGNLTYTPVQPLANESYHTVSLIAYDPGGKYAPISWKFYVNTYPDMADSSDSNCTTCHNKPNTHAMGNWGYGGTHSGNSCGDCHDYISVPAGCQQCHGDPDDPSTWNLKGHGDTPGIRYNLTKKDPYTPLRVSQNREMFDCVLCHQPGSPVKGYRWGYAIPTRSLNNHDLPELHKAPASGCSQCHAQSLTREHARPGRLDKNGLPVTCNTCHMSTAAAVVNAIAGNNKNCSACHGQADHESMHVSGLDSSCRSCHKAALTGEHLANATTAGKNFNCDTCHASTEKGKKRAIAMNNLNCAACHSQGHNMHFADRVPDNIPLYTGYRWTTPMETSIFAGEPGVPVGYEAGLVVISNRRADVTGDLIWDFYNRRLTDGGWSLRSGVPAAGTTAFVAEFVYGERAVTVKGYNTENSNGTGQQNSAGYRIEIWYR
jgi:hypothetical protein